MSSRRRYYHLRRYAEYVKAMAGGAHPNLRCLDKFLNDLDVGIEDWRPVTVGWLDLYTSGASEFEKIEINHLHRKVNERLEPTTIARIFVVEDLDRDVVEVLGSCLDLDPTFFANHIRDSFLESETNIASCLQLPSVTQEAPFYTIDYFTALNLHQYTDDQWRCFSNLGRRVDIFQSSGTPNRVAFVHRKFSVYVSSQTRREGHEGWKVVVLADPSIVDPDERHRGLRADYLSPTCGSRTCGAVWMPSLDVWPAIVRKAKFKCAASATGIRSMTNDRKNGERWATKTFAVSSFQGGRVDVFSPLKFSSYDFTDRSQIEELSYRRHVKLHPAIDFISHWVDKPRITSMSKMSLQPMAPQDLRTNPINLSCEAQPHHGIHTHPRVRTRRFLFDMSRHALLIAASESMLNLEALQAIEDVTIRDLDNIEVTGWPWSEEPTKSLEKCLDNALHLKHHIADQIRHLTRTKEFIHSVAFVDPIYERSICLFDSTTGLDTETVEGVEKYDYGLEKNIELIMEEMSRLQKACESAIFSIATRKSVRDRYMSRKISMMCIMFLPTIVVCSVLSLQDPFGPGKPGHWIFWAATVLLYPVTLLVLCIPFDPDRHGIRYWKWKNRVRSYYSKLATAGTR